ncbi:hypothetical protein [Gimesia sp.]|uniref:hypothetical protein n=1 Tax=Gimesia sp. TaxID=2024833 RepID=UPI003A9339C2
MENSENSEFDCFYPEPEERFMCDHKTRKLSAHIQPHAEAGRFFLTIYDFETMTMSAVKNPVLKSEVYLYIGILAPELMELDNFKLNRRESSLAFDRHNPDYKTVLDLGGDEVSIEYGPDENRNSFELAVVADIPREFILDPERN